MSTNIFSLFSLLVLSSSITASAAVHHHRRILHQPLFPHDAYPPTQSPSVSPQPKYPFSFTPTTPQKSFFPTFHSSPPPPPSPPATALATFPANISSILIPHPSSHPHRRVLVAVSVSLVTAAVIVALVSAVFLRRNLHPTRLKNRSSSDNVRLYPPNVPPSDSPTADRPLNHSSEFLYLGTLINSRGPPAEKLAPEPGNTGPRTSGSYQKLGSPEIRPLPPLPRHNLFKKSEVGCSGSSENGNEEGEEEEFFSPRGSVKDSYSPIRNNSSSSRRMFGGMEGDNFGSRSFNSRTASYPYSNSVSPAASTLSSPSQGLGPQNFSPRSSSLKSKSPLARSLSSSSMESTPKNSQNSPMMKEFVTRKLPPPPPPLPPARYWENRVAFKVTREEISPRPILVVSEANGDMEKNGESVKRKLKPLHWDKVKASSDRAMVWDQLKSSSFQLNEEMIETLFTLNATSMNPKENARRQVHLSMNQENRVLDPKKSQNIAILLKALNVTIDEVYEALLEGNADTLGTELLESLLKMAPSKEEEQKLKEFKDDSPIKLGPAEKFLKAVIDIPFAFKRVDAMLYIANFDSEVEYLRRSFETLEAACGELKNSRMFLKLLEAVLKTGNRMNVGTNRGDAHAFKLDTLLKLVDIKGTDGKTTLLHFVVQEIIRAEGSRLTGATASKNFMAEQPQQADLRDEVEYRKLGLHVVAGLSGELTNVKKAAAMDADVLSSDLSKLAKGIAKIAQVAELNGDIGSKESNRKFSESMKRFLKRAEEEIVKIQTQERVAFSLVKEVTEYFHGNLAKEEAHRLRIFMVVRDFLSILEQVCKEVGKINDRTTVSTARQYAIPVYPNHPPLFPSFMARQQYGSSDDEGSLP